MVYGERNEVNESVLPGNGFSFFCWRIRGVTLSVSCYETMWREVLETATACSKASVVGQYPTVLQLLPP
jgi:hypothetical protein